MNTQEARLFDSLSYNQLDAVVGGRMSNGAEQVGHVPQDGVPGGSGGEGNGGLLFGIAYGSVGGFIIGAAIFATS
jgi:hypothetical protein